MNNQELDTSWFDLKKYDDLEKLDLDGWIQLFIQRQDTISEECFDWDTYFELFKNNPVDLERISAQQEVSGYLSPCATPSVKPLKAISLLRLLNDDDLADALDFVYDFNNQIASLGEQGKQIVDPIDMFHLVDPISYSVGDGSELHLSIDLRYSDEHIINDLRRCLSEYRYGTGVEPYRKNVSGNDMKKWIKYKVLPYIDLTIVSIIEGKTISQVDIAKLLFKDDFEIKVPTETLRKTTKPEAEKLINLFSILPLSLAYPD